jgi:glycosyltransferase involved in cell wall biosynthesis
MLSSGASKHVLVLGVEPQSLLNFRKSLIVELLAQGHRVTVAALPASTEQKRELESIGAEVRAVAFSRAGMNPARDLRTLLSLKQLFLTTSPDAVIAYTAKPVIYGALAARWAGVSKFIAMITGLGFSFVEGPERSRKVARVVASNLYKQALRFCHMVIFQNPDDRETFQKLGLLKHVTSTGLVNGSGVDLSHYAKADVPQQMTFLMIARLLADKGTREYAAACLQLRKSNPTVQTVLVGGLDPSPNSVSQEELDGWVRVGLDYRGVLEDVRHAIREASVVVLPSYREGTPRSVLEGMAMGRAIITTDAPGCRETVIHGRNGLLVKPRDVSSLYSAMQSLANDADRVRRMGDESLTYVSAKFEAKAVAQSVLKLADLL